MEQLIILVIWVIGSTIIKSSNKKGKTNNRNLNRAKKLEQKGTTAYSQNKKAGGAKNIFSSFMVDLENELQKEKEIKRQNEIKRQKEKQNQFDSQWMQSSLSQPSQPSNPSQPKKPPKPKSPPKPQGLVTDTVGDNKEIVTINKSSLDLKRDILKGIIYAEILSEPKSLKNIKRSR
ncbi:MAG: hypothetical protein PHY91_01500 [Tissierellia bacterium]|nr:hypothetical protein [Tissierellia bacterium]MDD4725542.1 hypothetical protein [Tissierellia bacterium]